MLSKIARGISPSPTLAITARAKQLKSEGADIIGFGAGEPDFGTPAHIKKAAVEALDDEFTKYTPVSGIPELKEAVCAKLQNDNGLTYMPDQIVISNGAKHALANTFAALLNPGDEVLIPAPYWVTYPEIVKINHGEPKIIHTPVENGFKVTEELLQKAWTPRTKALVLNSPSNPTGQAYTREELEAIADFALQKNMFTIADEIYEKLVYEKGHVSIASCREGMQNLTVVINGLSKSYAMTGWRIGYSASPAELAKAMGSIQSHQTANASSIAQKAAYAALKGPQDCVEIMRQAFQERRDYIVSRVESIPYLKCRKPQGAFYLFVSMEEMAGHEHAGRKIKDGDDLAAALLEHYGVAVVPGRAFGEPFYIRLSYATSMENIRRGLDRIDKFVQQCGA